MAENDRDEALAYHSEGRPGKIEVVPTKPTATAVTAAPQAGPANDGRVVLVTLDGVRAEDVFDGADPSLRPGSKVDHGRGEASWAMTSASVLLWRERRLDVLEGNP